MSTDTRNLHGRGGQAVTLPCASCKTPTVVGKHCAECGTVATPPVDAPVVPLQREVVIDLTKPGDETLTVVLPASSTAHPDLGPGDPDQAEPEPASELGAADLLHDLGGEPGDPADAAARRLSAPSRRVGVLAGAGVIALVVLLVAGVLLTRYLGGSASRDALTASTRDFAAVAAAMTAATSVEQVSAAARTAPAAADRIEGQLRLLGRPDEAKTRAVVDQLSAETQLLGALAGLTALAQDPMQAWGAAHAPIAAALERERGTRNVLAAHDAGAAAALPDTAGMMTAVTSAVGTTLSDAAVTQAGDLLQALGAATNTAGVREAAGRAAAEQAAVSTVLPALSDQTGRRTLTAYSRALTALAGLASLDGDNTAAWGPARADLTAAFGELAGAGAEGAVLGSQATTTLAAVDTMVTRAAGQIADWKAAHEAEIADRNSDSQAMTTYIDSVRTELKTYELLRSDLQAFFARVEDPNVSVPYYEGYSLLTQAEEDRREVRDSLAGLSVPDGMRAEHNELIAVINRAISAVRAGYDGLSQADYCFEYCFYRDTPGYARFQSESAGITKAFAGAVQGWESTSGAVTASIKNRKLPAKPAV